MAIIFVIFDDYFWFTVKQKFDVKHIAGVFIVVAAEKYLKNTVECLERPDKTPDPFWLRKPGCDGTVNC